MLVQDVTSLIYSMGSMQGTSIYIVHEMKWQKFLFFFSSIEVSDAICSEIHSLSVLTADIYLEKSAPLT